MFLPHAHTTQSEGLNSFTTAALKKDESFAAAAKELSPSLRVVCAVKMSVLMFLRFSRPVKVSWEMVETN